MDTDNESYKKRLKILYGLKLLGEKKITACKSTYYSSFYHTLFI